MAEKKKLVCRICGVKMEKKDDCVVLQPRGGKVRVYCPDCFKIIKRGGAIRVNSGKRDRAEAEKKC